MDIVMGWLHKVDFLAVVAASMSFLLGLAVIKAQLGKAVAVIGDLADLLSEIKKSMADGKLDKPEIEAILAEGQELLAEFKK
jgi:hypothetical protein